MRRLYATALAMSLLMSGCTSYSGYQLAILVETGRVIDVQHETSSGQWAPGAMVGGGVGLITGQGHSTESKVIRTSGGALIGAAINKALTNGEQNTFLLVQKPGGQILRIPHTHQDLIPGDCITMESRGSGSVKVFRTSHTQCNF